MRNLLKIIESNSGNWFKSLDFRKRVIIADFYSDDTGDNTYILNGLTKKSQKWLALNYSDDIKDYIILQYEKEKQKQGK